MLNRLLVDGEIVIGEGEIDEAPMLIYWRKSWINFTMKREKILQPMLILLILLLIPLKEQEWQRQGQPNAITVLAVGKKGSF